MATTNLDILQVLLEGNYITPEIVESLNRRVEERGTTIEEELLTQEVVTRGILGQALAEYYQIPYWDINAKVPSDELLALLPERVSDEYGAAVVDKKEDSITVALGDYSNYDQFVEELKALFPGLIINFVYALEDDIRSIVQQQVRLLNTHIQEILKKKEIDIPSLVLEIIKEAIGLKTSDIHFEPSENDVLVRFRVDGILQDAGRFDKTLYHNVVNRIKVLAKMRLDEHYAAQDGAIRTKVDDNPVDLRVSIIPTLDDEKIVIRILTNYFQSLSLSALGLRERDEKLLIQAAKKPFGMILVTGPTGSGKTTTLYSLLRFIKNKSINITTIEDPVEYKIPGVNQIQVNRATNLTFPLGLRSIVRQDPDVILVGEIRDKETAEIALNAALTGHLVLSTFHANDAATAVPRLLDMGAEPFLLASALNLIISQRLVRKIDQNSRYSRSLDKKELSTYVPNPEKYFGKGPVTLYEGKPAATNNNTGFKGRTAIFESIYMNPEMQELILTSPSSKDIRQLATSQGAETFFQDGVDKVLKGVTTLDELIRVAPIDETIERLYEGESKKK